LSGLAGGVALHGAPFDRGFLDRAAEATRYLAPDGVECWSDGHAGFVRFRHVTTPQAEQEHQPATDARTGLALGFDGRLDNRDELIRDLPNAGLDQASGDAAIVLALYVEHGDACVRRLVGDYAFGVWQPHTRRLFCARSPGGWRPLFWCRHGDMFAFATEPKALVDGLPLPRRLNEGAIAEFLSLRFTSQTETFWQDLQRLPPGSALTVEGGRVRTWHWHTGPFPESPDLDEAGHVARFRELFDQSIASAVRSATPVAAHLSGGLDSSSIVCRATELLRAGVLDTPVRPISCRFPGEPHDETEFSTAVERHLGIQATVVNSAPYDWDWSAAWCSQTLHLPLRPNVLGTVVATCRRLHADGIRVLLTGEGGDDFLAGSRAHWPDLLRRGQVRRLLHEGLLANGGRSQARLLAHVGRHSLEPLLSRRAAARLERPYLAFSHTVPDWIRPGWAVRVELQQRWRADRLPVELDTLWQRQRYAPFILARRHVNVENVNTFAASEGVEMRHPLHDRRLTEYLISAPGGLFLRGNQRKYLLREAMRGVLPEVVRLRDTKANFTMPFVDAVVDRMADRRMGELEVVRRGWVDGPRLEAMLTVYRHWREGPRGAFPEEPLAPVWSALAMDVWLAHAFRS